MTLIAFLLPMFQFSIHMITESIAHPYVGLLWPDCTLSHLREMTDP